MSTIKSSSEDLTLNADGSNDIKFQSNGVEKASISSAGAFTSTTIDATKLTGEKRNFIIDGDMTQTIGGTSAAATHAGSYYPALKTGLSGHDGTATWERSTDVPTQAASGHQSAYSLLMKCTGTDATIGAAQQIGWRGFITGNDFASLHQQEFTYSFWAKTSAQNSGHNYNIAFANSAWDRTWVQTFSPTSTWTKFTFTLTGDTVGTFLFTEADRGLQVVMTLAAGTDRDDGTEGAWVAGSERWASSGTAISNFLDHTSNEFYFTQEQLVLGSVSPDFTSPPIATVRDQVGYYVEKFGPITGNLGLAVGKEANTNLADGIVYFNSPKRNDSYTVDFGTVSDWLILYNTTSTICTAITTNGTWKTHLTVRATATGTPFTGGNCTMVAQSANSPSMLVDARH